MPQMQIRINELTPWVTRLYRVMNPLHAQIAAPLKSYFYEVEQQDATAIASGVAAGIKENLYESRFDLFDHEVPAVRTLKEFCAGVVMEVARHANAGAWTDDRNFSMAFEDSWFHITRDGGHHDMHNHPNCSWCGIYYVDKGDASGTNGANAFLDPRPAASGYRDHGTQYLKVNERYDVTPTDGMLVVFPSYLLHSATLYRGRRDRHVVAFNASIMREKPPA